MSSGGRAARRRALAGALGILGSRWAGPALANGRFPAAGQIAVHPSDPSRLVVRATYGLLVTRDAGENWDWICEEGVGYGGVEDPALAITGDGTLLAGVFEGLSVAPGEACDFSFVGGELADRYFIDVSVDRADPARAIALSSNGLTTNQFVVKLWESPDGGHSWDQAGVDLPTGFLGFNVDSAPSAPDRVYSSGSLGAPDYTPTLARSRDRGLSWQTRPIVAGGVDGVAYLSAVDPLDPDVVYVRLDGEPADSLVVSRNAGETWEVAFEAQGNLLGFALSPDGETVTVGGDTDGVWTAPASTLAFEKVSEVGAECLTWAEAGLYACAREFRDGFTVGLSTDEGRTFSPLMHLPCVRGPLACAPETSVGKVCRAAWPPVQQLIDQPSCYAGSSVTGASSTGGDTRPGQPSEDGCACRAAPGGAAGPRLPLEAVALLLVLRWASARRRVRRAPPGAPLNRRAR